MSKLKALHAWTGPEGDFIKDQPFESKDPERTKFLVDGGFAAPIKDDEVEDLVKNLPPDVQDKVLLSQDPQSNDLE